MRRNISTAQSGGQIWQQAPDHEPVDFTRSCGSVGVGMKPPYTSRNQNKVFCIRADNTSQEPTQWTARGEAIGSSRSTGKRGGRYYNVPGNRASRLQHHNGNIEYGRAPEQNEG